MTQNDFPELVVLGEFDEQLGPTVTDIFPRDWAHTYSSRIFEVYEANSVRNNSDVYAFKSENTKQLFTKHLVKDSLLEHLVSKSLCGDFIYSMTDGPTAKKMTLRMDGVRWFDPPAECLESEYDFVACQPEKNTGPSLFGRLSQNATQLPFHQSNLLPLSDFASASYFSAAPPADRENMVHGFLALLDYYVKDVTYRQNPYFKQHSVAANPTATPSEAALETTLEAMRTLLPTTVSVVGVLFSIPDTYARGFTRVGCFIHVCSEEERRRHSWTLAAHSPIPRSITLGKTQEGVLPRIVQIVKLLNGVVDVMLTRADVLHRREITDVYSFACRCEEETVTRVSNLQQKMVEAQTDKKSNEAETEEKKGRITQDKNETALADASQMLERIRDELQSVLKRVRGLVARPSPAVPCREVAGAALPDTLADLHANRMLCERLTWTKRQSEQKIDWDTFEEDLGRVCISSLEELDSNKVIEVDRLLSRGFQPLRTLSALSGDLMWRFVSTRLHCLVVQGGGDHCDNGGATDVEDTPIDLSVSPMTPQGSPVRPTGKKSIESVADALTKASSVDLARLAYAALCGRRLCVVIGQGAHPRVVAAVSSLTSAVYDIDAVDARLRESGLPPSLTLIEFVRHPVIIAGVPTTPGDDKGHREVHPPAPSAGVVFVEVGTSSLIWRFPEPFDSFLPFTAETDTRNTHGFRHFVSSLRSLEAVRNAMKSLRQMYSAKSKLVLNLARIHIGRANGTRAKKQITAVEETVEALLSQKQPLFDIMKKLQIPQTKEEVNILRHCICAEEKSNFKTLVMLD